MIVLSLAYATLRYSVFKGVRWQDWPVYVVNKAVALAALLLLVLWLVRVRGGRGPAPMPLLLGARRLAIIHAGLSLAILTPAYFPALFVDGTLTLTANLSTLTGVLVVSGMLGTRSTPSESATHVHRLAAIAAIVGLHAAILGYGSWLTPSGWPGYLPPITLISGIAGLAGLVVGLSTGRFGDSACAQANK